MQPDPTVQALTVTEGMPTLPEPLPRTLPAWFWSAILGVAALGCALGWLLTRTAPLLWGLVPYTMLGNSLARIPYDWYLPAIVQHQPAVLAVALATLPPC